jgi:hypothetical protein
MGFMDSCFRRNDKRGAGMKKKSRNDRRGAGMTEERVSRHLVSGKVISNKIIVIPYLVRNPETSWIPAFAGMTKGAQE